MGRGNPKAFEGVREPTQFKAAGDEPLTAKVDLRLTRTMADDLKAIKNWQAKLRGVIATLIASETNPLELTRGDELEQGQLNRSGIAEQAIATKPTSATRDGRQTPTTRDTGGSEDQASDTGAKSKGSARPRAGTSARKTTRTRSRRKQTDRAN